MKNAHFKVNGSGGAYPDFGVIEGNTLRNGSVRDTGNPVTPVDLARSRILRAAPIGN